MFMYAVLFFYSLLYEHYTRSRYQLFMLPIQRQTHLTAKLAAVVTWIVISVSFYLFYSKIIQFLHHILPDLPSLPGRASVEVIVLAIGSLITGTILICSLVMIGYTVAVCFRRMPLLVGSVTVIAGYVFVKQQQMTIHQLFTRHFPWQMEVPALYQVLPWFNVVFPAAAALLIIVPALLLYERYGEV